MKSTGIVRKVDELGRIVLPIELRRTLDIAEKDAIEIYVDGESIILKKHDLNDRNAAVAAVPRATARDDRAHDIRPGRRADAPHAVQPAHVLTLIVQGDIVIERRIHASCAEPIRDRPEAQLSERMAGGEAEQCHGSQRGTERRDLPRPQPARQAVTLQTGNDRTH